MEFNDKTQDDVLERLAHTEQLVVELKELIRQKDTELQQKDEVLQVPLFWLFLADCILNDYYWIWFLFPIINKNDDAYFCYVLDKWWSDE